MKSLCFILLVTTIFGQNSLHIDMDKSSIKWKGTKSTGSYHDGLINVKTSQLDFDKNNQLIGGEIIIDMNSIICTDIQNKKSNRSLVKHLKDDDFFGTDIFPISRLVITNVEKIDEQNFKLIADLTIKENTHPIEFIANIIYNNDTGLASGKIEIDRSKYNVKYRSKSWYPDIGDRFINDNFELFFNLLAKSK
ncbi:MAG: hypothetical protein CMG54_02725 [Candidatus Marinimicrobia bacterium]|nr:hypothetical protein [Candidatus Neomarinimicrobiota bacterium]|tara:strand:+ start:503 stop:1081 length:579 start_codon:yes stop_codon:yes gene_type:complete